MEQRNTPKPATPLVLIIDDDPGVRDICARYLEAAGYRTASAASAEEAMQTIAAGELPGLVILDLMMPGTDGFATMHTLRQEQRTAKIPILVLTALAYHVEPATKRLGASAFCTKPLDLRRLEAQVRRLCPLPGTSATPRPGVPPSQRP